MKRLTASLIIMGSISASHAFAGTSQETPILSKRSVSGFVPKEWRKDELCEIYMDRIVITRKFGMETSLTTIETRQNKLVGAFGNVLQEAAEGKVMKEGMLVIDVPSYEYKGWISKSAKPQEVILKQEDGNTASLLTNVSPAAMLLVNVIDSACPKAFE